MFTRKKHINLVLSLVLSIGLVYLILRGYDISNLKQVLSKLTIEFYLIAFLLHLILYFLRNLILAKIIGAYTKEFSFFKLLKIQFLYNFYVHMVPAGFGEFSLPILLKNKLELKKGIRIVIIYRLFLLAGTFLLLLISIFLIDFESRIKLGKNILSPILIGVIIAIIVIATLVKLKKLKVKWMIYIEDKIKIYLSEIRSLLRLKSLLLLLLISVFVYIFTSVFYYFILITLDIRLNLAEVYFASAFGIAAYVLPIKSLAGIGTFEGFWILGLSFLGIERQLATNASILIHYVTLLNATIIFGLGWMLNLFEKNGKN